MSDAIERTLAGIEKAKTKAKSVSPLQVRLPLSYESTKDRPQSKGVSKLYQAIKKTLKKGK